MFKELFKYRDLLFMLAMRDIRVRYKQAIMGLAWAISMPIVPVTDAGLLGAQADGVIMVIQANRTQKGVVKHGEGLLKQARARILGYILTNIQYHIPAYIYRYL